ncbi:hypothetical protein Taro_012813 [Colocasia esculenta]|uniref:Uncharacterized protein n=1 Tax=Colocasia esculenta TaxID=4460 RepID=A0A843U9V3_COLES|nr:hypothetical protein [Colocasia esculenta]
MPPHGTDYWFMTPVSNPDNTTQEQPLSLAVTDVRSNCRSTTQVKPKNYGDQPNHHNLQVTHLAGPCLAPLWPELSKVRHWKTELAGDQYVYWCP